MIVNVDNNVPARALAARAGRRSYFLKAGRATGMLFRDARPISLYTKIIPTVLRFADSRFPINPTWTWEFHPLKLRFCLSQTLWNPESDYRDWPYYDNDILQGGGGGHVG